ncbi:hypothetical protein L3X38_013154 [Prunus dulcis]|uniref:Uncharacterized protein n=1 Tax=Prunus dulcis TaxID=3755 RepID=A0AAD4ZFX0_PRUDU|nr:hypothetical protein L3X38_013154 [Prunus dulcis]
MVTRSHRGNSSRKEERPANGEDYTLPDLITAIHAMEKSQREIIETIKDLKNSVSNQNHKNEAQREKTLLENSAVAGRGSEHKETSFVTHEDYLIWKINEALDYLVFFIFIIHILIKGAKKH